MDQAGRSPIDDFMDELPTKIRAKLIRWLVKLGKSGPNLPRPYADTLRGKIRELRLVFASQQIRCLYFFAGKQIVITNGFIKKTDQVPENEISLAERRMADFIFRKESEAG